MDVFVVCVYPTTPALGQFSSWVQRVCIQVSFSYYGSLIKAKKSSLPYYSPITEGRKNGSMPFTGVLFFADLVLDTTILGIIYIYI